MSSKHEDECLKQVVCFRCVCWNSSILKELEKHVVKVDMWRVSCWTFNEYYGVKKQKLSQIANRDPNMELRILRKLSRPLFANFDKVATKDRDSWGQENFPPYMIRKSG